MSERLSDMPAPSAEEYDPLYDGVGDDAQHEPIGAHVAHRTADDFAGGFVVSADAAASAAYATEEQSRADALGATSASDVELHSDDEYLEAYAEHVAEAAEAAGVAEAAAADGGPVEAPELGAPVGSAAAPTPAPAHMAPAASPLVDAIPDPTEDISPEDTAEIDVAAVEAKLNDPGSTQSFAPITDDRIDTDSTFDAGTTTSLRWGARSDVGCVRSHNEDSYLVASPLFAVCDGMGGHAAGEVASSIAVETIAKMAPKAADPAQLGAAIEAANAAVIEAAVNGLGKPGMGCTATAAYLDGTTLAIAHVGDSRAYLVHEGTLIRVTRDHSYVEELVDAGEITADEARVHPNRSVITRALGSDPAMYADHFQLNVEEGDRLILCSDGLSGMVPDGEIENIANQSSTAQICTDNLVDAALAAGGSDNVTVVVVDIVNDGRLRELVKKRRRNVIIGAVSVLAMLALVAGVALFGVSRSVYLGIKDDCVAVYSGVPGSVLGLRLHWLEDETSVRLEDLPEDTQRRLREGIPQETLESANDTVENYRNQIDQEASRQIQDAATLRRNGDPAAASANPVPAAPAPDSAAAPNAATPSAPVPQTEGGAAQ